MRVLAGVLVLCLGAWQTHVRAQDWRSDRALWTAATVTAPRLPRPWVNRAGAEGQSGRWAEATAHLYLAVLRADLPEHAAVRSTIREHVWRQLFWIDGSFPVCDRPEWVGWCGASWP